MGKKKEEKYAVIPAIPDIRSVSKREHTHEFWSAAGASKLAAAYWGAEGREAHNVPSGAVS